MFVVLFCLRVVRLTDGGVVGWVVGAAVGWGAGGGLFGLVVVFIVLVGLLVGGPSKLDISFLYFLRVSWLILLPSRFFSTGSR